MFCSCRNVWFFSIQRIWRLPNSFQLIYFNYPRMVYEKLLILCYSYLKFLESSGMSFSSKSVILFQIHPKLPLCFLQFEKTGGFSFLKGQNLFLFKNTSGFNFRNVFQFTVKELYVMFPYQIIPIAKESLITIIENAVNFWIICLGLLWTYGAHLFQIVEKKKL